MSLEVSKMEESILDSVKRFVGIEPDDEVFDQELLVLINSVFMTLQQIGVGPQEELFHIEDRGAVWSDYIEDPNTLPMIKPYISIKVRLIFDPPSSSALDQALRQEIAEYEWRMNLKVDDYSVDDREEEDNG